MRLYHYTCEHARNKIIIDWVLKPHAHAYKGLLWLTDLDQPDILGLGLTSFMLKCDRTAYRVTVETDLATPWTEWAHENKVQMIIRMGLDGNPGSKPLNWWVATEDIPVLGIEPTFSKTKTVK